MEFGLGEFTCKPWMRQTSFHLLTPDHVRGRAFSVFNMFSQGANSVGAAEIGFMASLLGAPGSLLFGCVLGGLLTAGMLGDDAGITTLWHGVAHD